MARFLLAFVVAVCTVATAAAAVAAPPTNGGNFLTAHNKARAAAKVGPLVWSLELALKAKRIVEDRTNLNACNFTNVANNNNGVNQWRSVGLIGCTPQAVVDQWMEQQVNYDQETHTCQLNKQCGSYLQVVARRSVFLGCAEASCTGKTGGCLAVCLYNPPAKTTSTA